MKHINQYNNKQNPVAIDRPKDRGYYGSDEMAV